MKINLAICDDETTQIEYLNNLVREWATERKLGIVISAFESAETFLFSYEDNKAVDLLLLDIQMKELDGISLAKKLRGEGGLMQIIFITGLPEFIGEGYEVSALHYLLKPVSREKLFAVLDKAYKLLDKADESILVESENGQIRLYHRDIQYIEAFAHSTNIGIATGSFAARISISDFDAILGDEFFRCHRSYLVNLRHVKKITKTDIILDSGKLIPLSRRRYNAANQAFISYYRGSVK